MPMISTAQSTSCSNFPHILGGTSGDTTIRQIDVYNDYLALGGHTREITLTGSSSELPYLALKSISTSGKYYWAKALSLKTSTYFYGV
jgi:hypothetical protein